MPRRGGRDRYRPAGVPQPRDTTSKLGLPPLPQRPFVVVKEASGLPGLRCRIHNLPWRECAECSRSRTA